MERDADKAGWLAQGCPEVIRGLDLARPAMLEASAGTGKTYAIEHLALRILTETEGIDLGQVLVLTYTEKATGELKEKIRARLASRVADGNLLPAPVRARLREAYLNFDRACVFTIHGFCQRVLRNYAFENRALFHHELADDGDILSEVLTEEMRSTWLSESGPGGVGLDGFRRLAGRMGMNVSGRWKDKWLNLARSWNPLRGDRLLPEADPDGAAALEEEILSACAEVLSILGNATPGSEKAHPAYRALAAGTFPSPSRKKSSLELFEALILLMERIKPESGPQERMAALREFLNTNARKSPVKEGFRQMLPDAWPTGPDSGTAACETALAAMERIRIAAMQRRKHERAQDFEPERRVVAALREGARKLKRERGVHSFDDMIQDLSDAIESRPELVAALRRQFRFCIVDEFQDTDPLQWRIFKRVFLESEGANPLYLIGDPKQAIYGFRGGDVHTYLDARGEMRARSGSGMAAGLGLDANFRSARSMIEACNRIFTQPGWFRRGQADPGDAHWRLSPSSDPRGYVNVSCGGLADQECLEAAARGPEDSPAGVPIVLRDFGGETRKTQAQRKIHQWIVSEILSLTAAPGRISLPDGRGGHRPLDWGDICVLIWTRGEKKSLETAFQKAGIPFQVHKLPGLYRSDAAAHFLAVLESLEDPSDPAKHARALLTRFFRPPGDPPPSGPPADLHPAFEGWRQLADRRQWPRLIQAMLFQTGLLYRESLEPGGERRVMDFIHLGQNLVREALRDNLSLTALTRHLKDWREAAPDAEEERHLHREDSESRKVAVMTMHSSKGLEFPVVFLAGLSGFGGASVLRYHAEGRTVFHLDAKDPDARHAAEAEDEDEKRRLFYVALTRAKYKLYVPLPPALFSRKYPCALGGFVADALRAAHRESPGHFHFIPGEAASPALHAPGIEAVPKAGAGLVSGKLPGPLPDPEFLADFPRDSSLSGPDADFSRRRRRLSSYSLLVRHAPAVASEEIEGRYDKDETPAAPGDADADADRDGIRSAIPGNALPRGRETGNLLHGILEDIDFAAAAAAETADAFLAHRPTRDLIVSRMEEYRMEATHLGELTRLVWNTLRAPVPDPAGGPPFALGAVAERRPEMEFLFPRSSGGGYLWGYIDLVFRHQGRFYLLDWKSNWLESYRPAEIEADMKKSRYDLQYRLYALALDKWLRSILPGYSFDRHFGGVCYVYMRGMGSEGSGAFVMKPTAGQIEVDYPSELDRALAASGASIPDVGAVTGAGR